MKNYLLLSRQELEQLYVQAHLTQRQIASRYGCTVQSVRKAMREYGLGVRLQKRAEIVRACTQCGKATSNPKFCSRSCAAIFNNTRFPKRSAERIRKQRYCERCGAATRYRRKFCAACKPNILKWQSKTIAELRTDDYGQTYRIIRMLARKIYADSNLPRVCAQCGYAVHIEVCHIKPIKSFDKATRIVQVNALENLIALCPNHHWELDNGLMQL